jgi:chromosome partitioning protein
MAKTLAVTNKKGGVGKTTIALNTGIALAALGYKVGIVDMDPQGHISVSLDVVDEEGQPREGVFNLLVNGYDLDDVIYEAPLAEYQSAVKRPGGVLWVLPGWKKTQLAAVNIQLEGGDYAALGRAIRPLKDRCDVVIFDTAPSNSLFEAGILEASDDVLIPTQLSRLSVDGVHNTVREMANLNKLHDAQLIGIAPVMVQSNTIEDRQRQDELEKAYGNLIWSDVSVKYSAVWRSASEEARSIFSFESKTNPRGKEQAEAALWVLVDKLVKVMELEVNG